MNPSQTSQCQRCVGQLGADFLDNGFSVFVPALLNQKDSKLISRAEERGVELQTATIALFNFPRAGKVPQLVESRGEEKPEICAVGEDAYSRPCGGDGSLLIATVEQQSNGTVAPMDVARRALKVFEDHVLRAIQQPLANEDLNKRIGDLAV